MSLISIENRSIEIDKTSEKRFIEFLKNNDISLSDNYVFKGEFFDPMTLLTFFEQISADAESYRRKRHSELISNTMKHSASTHNIYKEIYQPIDDLLGNIDPNDFKTTKDIITEYNIIATDLSLYDKIYIIKTSSDERLKSLNDYIQNSCLLWPYNLIEACRDKLIMLPPYTINGHFFCYDLKPGSAIKICVIP